MLRHLGRIGAAALSVGLLACGAASPPGAASATPTIPGSAPASATPASRPSATTPPPPSASPPATGCDLPPIPSLCVGRPATAAEQAAMLAAGVAPAEADLGLRDSSACQNGSRCFQLGDPPRAMVGTSAGTFYGSMYTMGGGGGAGCWVYLFEDASGWHFNSARCAQAAGSTPGLQSLVWVSGCANVRSEPSLSASRVLDCLKNGTTVNVDSAPVYSDGHIWWHLASRGWMAHDFLIEPKPAGAAFPG